MSLDGTTGTTVQTTTTASAGALGAGTSASSAATNPLGQDAFLNLMMTQLKDQDPLDPSDPTQYLGELAQMTSVEQETDTAQSVAQSVTEQNASTAVSLIGHNVTYSDSNGDTQTGEVQSVTFTSTGPSLTINGTSGVDLTSISGVA